MLFRRRRRALADPAGLADPLASVDPTTVPLHYRSAVDSALRAREQFSELIAGLRSGPLQENLTALGRRVDAGVLAVWGTAQHAAQLERVLTTLDPDRVADDLKRAKRDGAPPEMLTTLNARFASVQRLLNALEDLRNQLPVLEARLETVIARTAELTLTSPAATTVAELEVLGAELDNLTLELQALTAAATDLA